MIVAKDADSASFVAEAMNPGRGNKTNAESASVSFVADTANHLRDAESASLNFAALIDAEGPPPRGFEPDTDHGEYRLVLGVLRQALSDLGDPRLAVRNDARQWFEGEPGDGGTFGSLAMVADVSGLGVATLRRWGRRAMMRGPRRAVVW